MSKNRFFPIILAIFLTATCTFSVLANESIDAKSKENPMNDGVEIEELNIEKNIRS